MNLFNRSCQAFALVLLALSAPAAAQTAAFDWWTTSTPSHSKAAWAVKTDGKADALPQLMILVREAKPSGVVSGGDIRKTQLLTFDVDCQKSAARPFEVALYNQFFDPSGTQTVTKSWFPFTGAGYAGEAAKSYCAKTSPAGQTMQRFDITGAQRWLDSQLPRNPVPPTGVLTFEYGGPLNSSQSLDLWLETSSIKREGNIAQAWVLEIWEDGWQAAQATTSIGTNPATWSLREFTCDASATTRETWAETLTNQLATIRSAAKSDRARAASDVVLKSFQLRVCNNRSLLFSETIKADIKNLVASRYPLSRQRIGLGGVKFETKPRPQPVDLGNTIRITQKDKNYSYIGAFNRDGASPNIYKGQISFPNGKNAYPVTLTVVGIVEGQLMLRRDNTFDGQMAIPIASGKPSGKGIYAAFRHDDTYSWSLVEPATVTLK